MLTENEIFDLELKHKNDDQILKLVALAKRALVRRPEIDPRRIEHLTDLARRADSLADEIRAVRNRLEEEHAGE